MNEWSNDDIVAVSRAIHIWWWPDHLPAVEGNLDCWARFHSLHRLLACFLHHRQQVWQKHRQLPGQNGWGWLYICWLLLNSSPAWGACVLASSAKIILLWKMFILALGPCYVSYGSMLGNRYCLKLLWYLETCTELAFCKHFCFSIFQVSISLCNLCSTSSRRLFRGAPTLVKKIGLD